MEVDAESIEKLKQGITHEHVVGTVNAVANRAGTVAHNMTAKVNAAIQAIDYFFGIRMKNCRFSWAAFRWTQQDAGSAFRRRSGGCPAHRSGLRGRRRHPVHPGQFRETDPSRAGLKERKQLGAGIAAAINACDGNFLQELVEGVQPAPVVRPLHFAIHRKLEAGDDKSWTANWSAVTGIDAELTLPGIELLGNLFYRERLCLKFGG